MGNAGMPSIPVNENFSEKHTANVFPALATATGTASAELS
jgi:hypothetical protein